jgi:hypothetical protein
VTGDLKDERLYYDRSVRRQQQANRRARARPRGPGPGRGGRGRRSRSFRQQSPAVEGDADAANEPAGQDNVRHEARDNDDTTTTTAALNDNGSPSSSIVNLELLELHSSNPIITVDGAIYSCHWAQELGTNLYFAKKEQQPDGEYHAANSPHAATVPLRSLHHEHDLLGLGAIKLVALPAELRPKPAQPPSQLASTSLSLPPDAPESKKRQAAFLEQLAALKRQKGDRDAVILADRWGRRHDRQASLLGPSSSVHDDITRARHGSEDSGQMASQAQRVLRSDRQTESTPEQSTPTAEGPWSGTRKRSNVPSQP